MSETSWSRREGALFRAMYERLRRFAGAVGPWEIEPEDLLQEALTRALQLGPLDRLGNPEAYLRRTMVNLSTNFIRRRENTRRVHAAEAGSISSGHSPVYPSDLTDLLALDPVTRSVLYLHDVDGYSFPEVSALLGMPESSCRQVASRGRRALRELYESEDAPS